MLPILIILYILSTYSHSDSPHMNCSRMPPKLGNAHVDFTEETSPPAPSRRSASGMECGDASPLSLSAEQTGIAFIPRGMGAGLRPVSKRHRSAPAEQETDVRTPQSESASSAKSASASNPIFSSTSCPRHTDGGQAQPPVSRVHPCSSVVKVFLRGEFFVPLQVYARKAAKIGNAHVDFFGDRPRRNVPPLHLTQEGGQNRKRPCRFHKKTLPPGEKRD